MAKFKPKVRARDALEETVNIAENMAETAGRQVAKEKSPLIQNAQNFAKKIDESIAGQWFDNTTGLTSMGKNLYKQSEKQGGPGIVKGFGAAAEKAGYYKTANGQISEVNVGKIAGAYLGVSAGARIVSGGGLYKDNQGNTNLAGIPFI